MTEERRAPVVDSDIDGIRGDPVLRGQRMDEPFEGFGMSHRRHRQPRPLAVGLDKEHRRGSAAVTVQRDSGSNAPI